MEARPLDGSSLHEFKSRHLSKIQNWRHKQRSGQHTLDRQLEIYNKNIKPGEVNQLAKLARRQFLAVAGWVGMQAA
jgi:hypothetical protein